jgi:hypothetical protein
MELRNLTLLTWIVTIMVVLDALSMPFVAVTVQLFPTFFMTRILPLAGQVDPLLTVFKFATMIVFGVWIHRAGKNLIAAGYEDLEFTPGARIWWFAVPIANLFKPFQGMRELWNASHGEGEYTITPPLIAGWWAFWLASNILGTLTSRFPDVGLMTFSAIADIGVAALAIVMIQRIAAAQARLAPEQVAEVFA